VTLRKWAAKIVYGLYEKRLEQQARSGERQPRHIGVMLDGNRRWAREAGFDDVSEGHRAGAAHIENLLRWCEQLNIEVVTIWLLSTDNLHNRPSDELPVLLDIIGDVVEELAEPQNPWQLRITGNLDGFPADLALRLKAAEASTADRTGLEVNCAVGYGGRQEIADAVRGLLLKEAEAGTTILDLADRVTVDAISDNLYTYGQPNVDLIIRTSGEQRLSGFLLWQSANSELWFTEAFWPDFRRTDFLRAIRDYSIRHRRFGS
jgi:short-chain Z-isoprenyl diphosphate synthase